MLLDKLSTDVIGIFGKEWIGDEIIAQTAIVFKEHSAEGESKRGVLHRGDLTKLESTAPHYRVPTPLLMASVDKYMLKISSNANSQHFVVFSILKGIFSPPF